MENKLYRTQEREQPTSIDGVGKKRTHKVNKIYLLPLIIAIIFTFSTICVFADLVNCTTITPDLSGNFTPPTLNNTDTHKISINVPGASTDATSISFNNVNQIAIGDSIYELDKEAYILLCNENLSTGETTALYPIWLYIGNIENSSITTDENSENFIQIMYVLVDLNTYDAQLFINGTDTTWLENEFELQFDNKAVIAEFTICEYLMKGETNEMTVIETVLAVFTAIGGWFAEIIPSMLAIFYNNETGLTVLGVLAVASLAIAVILLVLAWIVDFFKFRR